MAAGVASTEEAKRLAGNDEAETIGVTGAVAGAISLLFLTSAAGGAGISKTLRHTRHLKGTWAILISIII